MIQKVLKQACAAVWCLIVLSGCTAAAEGTASQPVAAISEGDQLIDSADLLGSVIFVDTGQFTVQLTEMDGDIAMQTAEGHEDAGAAAIVQWHADCTFENAVIDAASGSVTTTPATAEDVKRQSDVAVFGDTQADGSILATRVVIVQYTGTTGVGGAGA